MNFSKLNNNNISASKIILLFISFFTINTTINAQFFQKTIKGNGDITTIIRNVSDYNKISIGGDFNVTLVKGTEGEIIIKADEFHFEKHERNRI